MLSLVLWFTLNSPIDNALAASFLSIYIPALYVQVYFDYDEDEVMAARRGKFLSLTNQEGLLFMRQRGYEHVQTMLAEGKLDLIKEAALPLQKNTAGGSTRKD